MATKIQLTITASDAIPIERSVASMSTTIQLLARAAGVPVNKVTVVVECDDAAAELHEDELDAVLSGRPIGIDVVMRTTRERNVERITQSSVTPMFGVSSVTLTHGERSAVLDAQTARNAAEMLREHN